MKSLFNAIPALVALLLVSSCSRTYDCTCNLFDKQSAIENGSRVIRMDIKALNSKKRAERNCDQYEIELTSDAQSANCYLQ